MGEMIISLMKVLCLSQAQLSDDLGVPYDTVRGWSSGRADPSRGNRTALAVFVRKHGARLVKLAQELEGVSPTEGSIELRSGVWTWRSLELLEGGGGEVVETWFWFQLRDSETSRMRFEWSGAFPDVDESLVALQARHPLERELRDPDGVTWLFYYASRPGLSMAVGNWAGAPYSVLFRSSDGGQGTADLPQLELCLGDATDEELLEIVRVWELEG